MAMASVENANNLKDGAILVTALNTLCTLGTIISYNLYNADGGTGFLPLL